MAFKIEKEQIFLGLKANNKAEVIDFCGEKLLELGFIEPPYIQAMHDRENSLSTYIGDSIAIPHGLNAKQHVIKAGLVLCQYPDGVCFGNHGDSDTQKAQIVVAVAAKNNSYLDLVSAITKVLGDVTATEILKFSENLDEVLALFNANKK